MKQKTIKDFSSVDSVNYIYHLEANFDEDFYLQRTDRNIGWITRDEQDFLRGKTVGVAGCGGMGGLTASILVRLGIGHVKIADPEVFDESNINRQFGAMKTTIGQSKALVTGRMLREISDDVALTIYPSGIEPEVVDDFVSGCDLIVDEIEFWGIGSRILLHQKSREIKVPILNANTVGHQTNLFLFDAHSKKIEDVFKVSLDEAWKMQHGVQTGSSNVTQIEDILLSIASTLVPDQPDYDSSNSGTTIRDSVLDRLKNEKRASIIAPNPVFASGFLVNHILFQLLKEYSDRRDIIYPPRFPGYLSIDSALMYARRVIK